MAGRITIIAGVHHYVDEYKVLRIKPAVWYHRQDKKLIKKEDKNK